jgi:ELWxxDGT repeat protein
MVPALMNAMKFCVFPSQFEAVKATVYDLLVVFDSRVPDLSVLLGAVVEGARCHVLSKDEDAIAVVTQLLANSAAKRLALVAHGEPGVLQLGANPLNEERLQVQSRLLQEWSVEEIALYGCEVGKDKEGRSFVAQLSNLTGARIAASEDQLGKGRWVLNAGSTEDMTVDLAFIPRMLSQYTPTLSSVQYNLNLATASSNPSQFTDVNGTLYFTANTSNGTELWKIDPLTGLPVLLEIESGTGSSNPSDLTNLNGILYFTATNSISGRELWKIDPSRGLPVLLEIESGSGSPNLNVNGIPFKPLFTNVNGTSYFLASTTSNGTELWKIDPNTGNPLRITDIKPGSVSSDPSVPIIDVNGTLYFTAASDNFPVFSGPRGSGRGAFFRELWRIDPNTGSPLFVPLDLPAKFGIFPGYRNGYDPDSFTNVNGTLYFAATFYLFGNGLSGISTLWKIDPISDVPTLIEIEPSSGGTFPFSSNPSNLTNVNGKLYFTARTTADGNQIWQIDLSTGNPVPVTNFDPTSNFRPEKLLNIDGTLYFIATDNTNGTELWKIDPTTGLSVLLEVEPGTGSSNPSNLMNLNGTLYFIASTASNGTELWKIDSSTGLPVLLEVEPGTGSSNPSNLMNLNGTLYFIASTASNGTELWKIDSSTGLPVLLEIEPGSGSPSLLNLSFPFTNANGTFYFITNTSSKGGELWKIDPNTGNLVSIYISGQFYGVQQLTNVNGILYFTAFSSNGYELWKVDPSTSVPVLVTTLANEPGTFSSNPFNFTNINGVLYFSTYTSSKGTELWKIDPSTGLPVLVADVNTQELGSQPFSLINVNGTVYFIAHINSANNEIWKIDPSTGNPEAVTNYEPINGSTSPYNLTNVNNILYFVDFNSTNGTQLWKINPNTGNPERVTDLGIGSRLSNLTNVNGTLYFIATDIINGTELWRIDPNTGSPTLLEIELGSGSSNPNTLVNANGTLYFIATNSTNGTELWRIDPTTSNPALLEIEPGSGSPDLLNFTNVNGALYFTASSSINGTELWKIDPSTGSPVLLEIESGGGSSYPSDLINVNGTLYFIATNSTNGTELWRIDPSTGNPGLLEIEPGNSSPNINNLTNVDGTLYFIATTITNGFQIWKIDPSTGNPQRVTDLDPGNGNAYYNMFDLLKNVGGTLYFNLFKTDNTTEFWKIDPITGKPVRVSNFDLVSGNAYPYNLMDVNGTVYFLDLNNSNGIELWKIDPSTGKPVLLEIELGSGSSNPNSLTNVNGVLYFIATNSVNGTELWKIDPSTGSPVLVQDFYPGSGSSNPSILGYENGKLYISADNGINGPELWAISTNNAPALTGPQAVLSAGTEDIAYTINVAELLVGFSDADGDTLSIFGLSASNSTLVNNNNGTYTLTPTANFNGTLTLTYNVIDNSGGSTAATQSIYFAPDNGGVSSGDPHLVTFDQFHYDFQSTGDFVLTRALDSDLEVQVRQAPWSLNPDTTLNVALATLVDGNRVEFYIDQPAPIVNGVFLTLQPGQSQTLGQGLISRTLIAGYGMLGDLYTITYPNGDVLMNKVFQGFLMDPSLDLAGSKAVTGLLGNNNGNAGDDLVLQDGQLLSNPLDPTVLYGDFANYWRVSDAQSLFSFAASLAALSLGPSNAGSLTNDVASVFENFVFGGNGDDALVGVQNLLVNPGRGEVDLLMGNKGADTFVLGDRDNRYYVGLDQQDYALITDFWAEDSIQLYGSAKDYVLGAAPKSLAPGTGIFLAANPNELIGIIQGNAVIDLNLSNTNLFHFV